MIKAGAQRVAAEYGLMLAISTFMEDHVRHHVDALVGSV
jgi:hypothetical protein